MAADDIKTVAVLGLGTMGHGIAQCFAAGGCRVRCFDAIAAARDSLHGRIRSNLHRMADAGMTDTSDIDATLERIVLCDDADEAVRGAQFVTEAVAEDLEIKRDLFAQVEPAMDDDAILASNSSSYPITKTAERMLKSQRALVTHWFNPPHIIPVVEVVPGRHTDETTTTTTCELLRRIGKTAVPIRREVPGFLVNRVQVALMREVFNLLDTGVATAEEIDQAIRGSIGLRLAALGPLQIFDFAGLDVIARVYRDLAPALRSDADLPAVVEKLVADGRFGTKSGAGFYDYTPQSIRAGQDERDRLYLELVKLLHSPKA